MSTIFSSTGNNSIGSSRSLNMFNNYFTSSVAVDADIFSTSVVNKTTKFSFLESQVIPLLPNLNKLPVVDFRSILYPVQSASLYAVITEGFDLSVLNFKCLMVNKDLISFSTASQSTSLGESFFLPSMFTFDTISGLVSFAMYKSPTTALFVSSIFLQ